MADSSFMMGNEDHATAVPFSDDETEAKKAAKAEEFEEEDSPTDTPEIKSDRRKRRAERIARMLDDGKLSAARVKELEERDLKRERELGELRGMLMSQQRPQNDVDPYQQQLDEVYARQGDAYNACQAEMKAGTFTPERQKHWERVAQGIESDKMRIHTERAISARVPHQRAESAQQVWVQKYPEVYQNPRAFQYAKATWERRKAMGEPESNSLVEDVMNETITQFKLGGKPAPSASEKNRLSGVPASGGGGAPRSGPVALTPHLRSMALARYGSEMPEEEAIKRFQNGVVKRLREKKIL